jgi:hypothetical protein
MHVRIDTNKMAFNPDRERPGVEIMPLFLDNREDVRLERWAPGATVALDASGRDGSPRPSGIVFRKGARRSCCNRGCVCQKTAPQGPRSGSTVHGSGSNAATIDEAWLTIRVFMALGLATKVRLPSPNLAAALRVDESLAHVIGGDGLRMLDGTSTTGCAAYEKIMRAETLLEVRRLAQLRG